MTCLARDPHRCDAVTEVEKVRECISLVQAKSVQKVQENFDNVLNYPFRLQVFIFICTLMFNKSNDASTTSFTSINRVTILTRDTADHNVKGEF